MPGNFRQRAGQLHAGRAATDNGETQPRGAQLRIRFCFGAFEGQQQMATQLKGVVQRFEAGCVPRPLVMAEVGVRGSAGQ